jgi:hypothetical protein
MDEPLAELSAYFRRKARLPDQELIRLTAADPDRLLRSLPADHL